MKDKKKLEKNIPVVFSALSEEFQQDNRWTHGKIRVMHWGLNPNGTYFSRETAESLVRSMRGVPVTGIYDYYKGDFTDHGKLFGAKEGPIPFGFCPHDATYNWVEVIEEGQQKEYLEIEVVMWTKKYPEIEQFISQKKNQSMELVPDDVYGYVGVKDGVECLIIEEAKGLALTILGDDVAPAFKSANLSMYSKDETFGSKFNQMVEVYNKYKGGQKSRTGGRKVFKFNEEVEALLKTEAFSTNKEDSYTVNVIPLQTGDTGTYGYSYEDNQLIYNFEDEIKTSDLEGVFSAKETLKELEEGKVEYEKTIEDKDAELEKYEKQVEDLKAELETANGELEEAKTNYSELLTKHEEAEETLEKLSEYKLSKEREEKEAIVEKYSKILTDEEKAAYSESIDEKTAEELKYELGVKAFDALSDEDNNTYNLNNKSKTDNSPSWVKEINKRRK